tara:strand:+ start:838 stop:1302 length:465 start_codon:yes stop_codon:yes gene_type:complete
MALSEARKKTLAQQKRRALMKDIDKREAAQKELSLMPYSGINAKRALRKASKQNEKDDWESVLGTDEDVMPRWESTWRGEDRDLRNIEKYGDNAMKSRAFGSRQTQGMMGGGKVKKPVAMSYGGKTPKKMGMGGGTGKCRGMGAATRGGNFKMG